MSTTFKVLPGDTFASIARKRYGTEESAGLLAKANPGAKEPLTAGTSLLTPPDPQAPAATPPPGESSGPEEVAIKIKGRRFRFWERVRITGAIDSVPTVEFNAPLDSELPGFREAIRPFSYEPVEVTVGGQRLFSGTLMGVTPMVTPTRKVVAVSAYGRPGVLMDCTAPASAFPLEFWDSSLRDIAAALVAPFGLRVKFSAGAGATFDYVALEPGQKIFGFLAGLAKLRNLVISSDAAGGVLFQQATRAGSPVAVLEEGTAPVVSVTAEFNAQGYYSHVTAVEDASIFGTGGQYTVRNARLSGVLRPFTFKAPDALEAEIQTAVEAKAGRMLGDAISYSLALTSWRTPAGELWKPNTTLLLTAPDALIYQKYEFLVKSVALTRDRKTETAALQLVLPEAYRGATPKRMPWDI